LYFIPNFPKRNKNNQAKKRFLSDLGKIDVLGKQKTDFFFISEECA